MRWRSFSRAAMRTMEGGSRERGGSVGEEKRREEVCGGGKAREKEDGKRSESQIFKTEKEEEIVFRMALRKFIYFSQVPWWNRWLGLAFGAARAGVAGFFLGSGCEARPRVMGERAETVRPMWRGRRSFPSFAPLVACGDW
jgi:hypothetical protein